MKQENKDIKFHQYHHLYGRDEKKKDWETDVGFMIAGNTNLFGIIYNENSMVF